MKKTRFFSTILLCSSIFCGCTVTSEVTSYGLFESTVDEVNAELERAGFQLVESGKDRSHDPHHSTHYYGDPGHGFSSPYNNDHVYINSYSFSNEAGETLTYSVSYRTGCDPSTMTAYVREVTVWGCEVSNPKHHERFCGDASPVHKFDSLPRNATVRH